MKSSKYLIAGGTVNWTEGLAKYYAEDERKRREHGERLAQRDAAQLQADKAASPIGALRDLANLSTTVSKIVKQQKAAAAQNAEAEKLEADVLLTKNILPKEWDEINRITRESVNNLKFDGAIFTSNVNASKVLSTAAKKTLTAQHGSSLYRIHEQIGFRSLRNLDAAIEAYGATDEGKDNDFQTKLDQARNSGDHLKVQEIYKKFAFTQFTKFGFNNKFIATNFSKPLDKFLNSRGTLEKLYYQDLHHTEQEIDWDNRFDSARKLYDNGDTTALTNEFHSQLEESNRNKGRIVTNYYRLGKSGRLTRDEYRALREGDLDEKLKFKAGSKGKDLLNDEQWAQIERGISENEAATVNGVTAAAQQQALTALATIHKGEGTVDELTQIKTAALRSMANAGLTDTKEYKKVEGTDVTFQKPEAVADIRQANHGYLAGSLQHHRLKDKKNFETIKSGSVQDELNALALADEQYYRDVSLPTTHKDHVDAAGERLKSSPSQKKRISGLAQVIDDSEFKELSKEVALKRQEFHIIARAENPGNNIRASAQAEAAFKQWEIDNGINEVDDGDNDNAGILSPTNEGIYRISKEKRDALYESNATGTRSTSIGWGQDLSAAHTQSGGNKEKALNTANSFTSHGDIQAALIEKAVVDDQNNFKPYYSPELIFKARALRIQPAQLLLKQIQALNNRDSSHKDKDFYERHNLQAYEEILKNDPGMKIEEALVNMSDDKGEKLLFLWRNGVENMTANQITRLIDSLSGFKWHPSLSSVKTDETFGHTIRTFK